MNPVTQLPGSQPVTVDQLLDVLQFVMDETAGAAMDATARREDEQSTALIEAGWALIEAYSKLAMAR